MNPLASLFRKTAVTLLCAVIVSAAQASPQSEFDAANRAFGAGKYADAIKGYESLIKQNGYSASVLFNLGNAYYRDGQVGLAILNYERALRLSPRDPDIQANLKFVRSQSGLAVPSERWWQSVLRALTPSQWAWLASGFLVVLCVLWIVRLLNEESIRRLGVSAALTVPAWRLVLFLLGVGLFLSVACGAISAQDRHRAIVVAKQASLHVLPFDKADSLVSLPEGEAVEADKKYGDYILVWYDKKKSGWVNVSQITPVEPDLLSGAP